MLLTVYDKYVNNLVVGDSPLHFIGRSRLAKSERLEESAARYADFSVTSRRP
jgi:hypothetical protein